jgi:hypothetical protein
MMRLLGISLLVLAGLVLVESTASAQPMPFIRQSPNPYYTPPLSPYLNMLRGGNPAVNYYLGVVPEFRQRTLNAQQAQYMNQQARTGMEEEPEMTDLLPTLPSTGHGTQFMNASPYFALNPYLGQNMPSNTRRPQTPGTRRSTAGR